MAIVGYLKSGHGMGQGGVVQTADPDDPGRLAAPYRTVVIEALTRKKGSPG